MTPRPGRRCRAVPAIAQDGLIRLACTENFAGIPKLAGPEFAPWLSGLGAAMFEALQPLLCDRWVTMERQKSQIGDWTALRDLGSAQEQVLAAFMDAAEKANRPDLVRFLLRAAAAVLSPNVLQIRSSADCRVPARHDWPTASRYTAGRWLCRDILERPARLATQGPWRRLPRRRLRHEPVLEGRLGRSRRGRPGGKDRDAAASSGATRKELTTDERG